MDSEEEKWRNRKKQKRIFPKNSVTFFKIRNLKKSYLYFFRCNGWSGTDSTVRCGYCKRYGFPTCYGTSHTSVLPQQQKYLSKYTNYTLNIIVICGVLWVCVPVLALVSPCYYLHSNNILSTQTIRHKLYSLLVACREHLSL